VRRAGHRRHEHDGVGQPLATQPNPCTRR
jgi:hypothetical protein